ncbi:MAG TPA: serine/threonine-protein kinase [Planctomycetaceae bacterium]|jgi:serine/threonine protein kinase/tetratricopeptide (TPR) repeat protein|nr:serine/threonine-protein kinase [Planctomycetaceae bacterium]
MTNEWSPSDGLRQLCDEQRESWQRGQRALVESFFDKYPALKSDESLLLDFILAEYTLRQDLGDRPTPTEYFQRFPHLATPLERLFELNEAINARTEDLPRIAEAVGTVIGPYRLLQKIGEGGFGVVFMAEQTTPVRRMVALKVIKPGMDCAQVIARFESERQALALMDHPNIAKVLDAGATNSGHPYFVMELVKGAPITEFCDKNHFSPEMRLKLFVDVCHAIQHAHHKGIIHRDIKPTNVMVTLRDGVPAVKVIDFGVAKATLQRLTERTLFTAYGQMVGTPAYMSPEQAEMSELDIDTRSDVYSLGVLLYELLTGTTPLEVDRLRAAGYAEIQRMIREEEAPRPSTRLSSLRGAATILAGNRGLEVKRLVQVLSGDLDWVVMKALEKDRNRRYDTPGNFAEDIDRYLRREAILARPPSKVYRLKKFAQRNRGSVLTAAFIVVALLVGTIVSTWQALRARSAESAAIAAATAEKQAKEEALAREAETKAVQAFMEDRIFSAVRPKGPDGGLGREVTLQKAIEAALPTVSQAFPDQPLIEARLRLTLGQSFLFLGNARTATQQDEAARALYTRYQGPNHPDTLMSLRHLAVCYFALGHHADAVQVRQEVLTRRKATLGPDHPDTLSAMSELANTYGQSGRYADELNLQVETLALYQAKIGPRHPATLSVMHNLADCYRELGRYSEAVDLFEQTLAMRKSQLAPDNPDMLMNKLALSICYLALDRPAEALKLSSETLALRTAKLGPEHPDTFASMNQLASCYEKLNRYDEAVQMREKTLALRKSALGPDHPDTLLSMNNLANSYGFAGRWTEALKLREETLSLQKTVLGPDHPDTLLSMNNLGNSYLNLGRYADAIKLLQETLALQKTRFGPDHPDVLRSLNNLAMAYGEAGRLEESLKISEQAVPLHKAKYGPLHTATLTCVAILTETLKRLGRLEDALKLSLETLATQTTKLGSNHQQTLRTMSDVAEIDFAMGRVKEALELNEKTLSLQKAHLPPDHPETLDTMNNLADCYEAIDRPADALKFREQTLAGRKTKLGNGHPKTLMTMWGFARSLIVLKRGAEALPVMDECLQRADGKDVDPTLVPGLIDLRLRLLESNQDAAGCRRTAELWEALNRNDAASFYRAARLRAVTAGVLRAANKSAEADAEADRAVKWLKQAVAAGYKNAAQIQKDKDLEPLRARQDVKKLVGDLQHVKESATTKH